MYWSHSWESTAPSPTATATSFQVCLSWSRESGRQKIAQVWSAKKCECWTRRPVGRHVSGWPAGGVLKPPESKTVLIPFNVVAHSAQTAKFFLTSALLGPQSKRSRATSHHHAAGTHTICKRESGQGHRQTPQDAANRNQLRHSSTSHVATSRRALKNLFWPLPFFKRRKEQKWTIYELKDLIWSTFQVAAVLSAVFKASISVLRSMGENALVLSHGESVLDCRDALCSFFCTWHFIKPGHLHSVLACRAMCWSL